MVALASGVSVVLCCGYHSVINRTIAQTGITTSPHGYANYIGQISIQKILDQIKENEKTMLQYRRDGHKILSLYEEMRKTIDYRENLELNEKINEWVKATK